MAQESGLKSVDGFHLSHQNFDRDALVESASIVRVMVAFRCAICGDEFGITVDAGPDAIRRAAQLVEPDGVTGRKGDRNHFICYECAEMVTMMDDDIADADEMEEAHMLEFIAKHHAARQRWDTTGEAIRGLTKLLEEDQTYQAMTYREFADDVARRGNQNQAG